MPISDCEVRDPRIRRTRQLLQQALRQLLESRSFEEISVQDITEAATVNRATFYDHYTDKFALLEALIAGGFHSLLQERSVAYNGSCPGQAAAIILAACDYLAASSARRACGERRSTMEPLEDAAMIAAIRRVIEHGMARDSSLSPEQRGIRAAAVSGAIYGAVKQWLNTPDRWAAEQAVPQIVELVRPLLEDNNRPFKAQHASPGQAAERQATL
jgi:AcrR family transcriptional regulator